MFVSTTDIGMGLTFPRSEKAWCLSRKYLWCLALVDVPGNPLSQPHSMWDGSFACCGKMSGG